MNLKCSNVRYSIQFLNHVGKETGHKLLEILNLERLIESVCCTPDTKNVCLKKMSKKNCFLHKKTNKSCKSKIHIHIRHVSINFLQPVTIYKYVKVKTFLMNFSLMLKIMHFSKIKERIYLKCTITFFRN